MVNLNWQANVSGTLSCLDGYMNIAMEDTTEHVDGVLKTTYGDAFIRGNNGMFLFLFVFFLHLQYNKHR